ncbi:MAG: TonB-dependent receptor [Prolixibacteraceae bacterium]|nr:TonB-dependent receptor [Prolixibacteraceae bacterium]
MIFYRKTGTPEAIRFKCWQRKSYSLFNVLKKAVIIAVLPLTYHVSAETGQTDFISDTTSISMEFELEEIKVSSRLVPVTFSDASRTVTVISSREIEAVPAQNIQELLEYIPGVDVRTRGGQGVQADISIRGSSFDQVMILLNGIDITDPQTGHHNLNLPVNLSQIERIEIIEGSASRVFGPNAFAGAINIITNRSGNNKIKINTTTGQHGYIDAGISGSWSSKKISQFLSAAKSSSAGYSENTDFENNTVFYKTEFGESSKIAFQLGFSDKSFGANSFYTPVYPDQYENTNIIFSSLKWESDNSFHFTPTVYIRKHNDRFELFRNEAPEWYSTHNYHQAGVYGGNLNGWFDNRFGKTAFGTSFRNEKILSNVLGNSLENPIRINDENKYYTKSDSRETYSVFVEHNVSTKKWNLSTGLMANHISGISRGFQFFPGADISYQMNQNLKLYISVNKSLRVPTFTDLYYSGPTNTGNPDLKPETAISSEGGLKYNSGNFYSYFAVFHRSGKNIIDWVRLENEEIWHTENYTKLNSAGFEIGFGFFPGKVSGKKTFIYQIKGGYLYNSLSKNNDKYISKYVLDNLKHKFNLSVTHYVFQHLQASWFLNFQDRNGSYTEYDNGSYGSEKEYKPFALIDMKLNYKFREIDFFINISNIFKIEYVDFGNIDQPGRWIKAGLNLDINYK